MANGALPSNPWRDALQPASFMGIFFYCDVNGEAGGRRVVVHEFPLRDTPFAEDMGRRAKRFTVSGYVLGDDYINQRDSLVAACETSGAGTLTLPTLGSFQVNCESYNTSERQEKGGLAVIEMSFVEAGSLDGFGVALSTISSAISSSQSLSSTTQQSMQAGLASNLNSGTIST